LSLSFALIEELLFALVTPVFGLPWFPRNFAATFRAVLPIDFHLNVIIYWLIVGIEHSVGYYRKSLERERLSARLELRATQLESQLTQAKLSALKMQLHPHFLFNTLNTIVVLVRQHRVTEADEMLTNLSELLRQSLAGWEMQEVPLRRELELTNLYLYPARQIPGPLECRGQLRASDSECSGPELVASAACRKCSPAWRIQKLGGR
jgi:sensor histidine kinase YesM